MHQPKPRVGLYGVSGSGKTTLLAALKQSRSDFIFKEGAQVIQELCGSLTEFQWLSDERKTFYREKAISLLSVETEPIIVAGHFSFPTENKYSIVMTEADKSFYTHHLLGCTGIRSRQTA
jgi:adenylate kinase